MLPRRGNCHFPSAESPPLGTMQCKWGCKERFCPQVWSTIVAAVLAPSHLGSRAKVSSVYQAALNNRLYISAGWCRHRGFNSCGNGENYMKISGGQELVLLLNDPHFLVQALTFWAMSVAATVITDAQMATLITSINMTAQGCGATSADSRKRSPVMRRESFGR